MTKKCRSGYREQEERERSDDSEFHVEEPILKMSLAEMGVCEKLYIEVG